MWLTNSRSCWYGRALFFWWGSSSRSIRCLLLSDVCPYRDFLSMEDFTLRVFVEYRSKKRRQYDWRIETCEGQYDWRGTKKGSTNQVGGHALSPGQYDMSISVLKVLCKLIGKVEFHWDRLRRYSRRKIMTTLRKFITTINHKIFTSNKLLDHHWKMKELTSLTFKTMDLKDIAISRGLDGLIL